MPKIMKLILFFLFLFILVQTVWTQEALSAFEDILKSKTILGEAQILERVKEKWANQKIAVPPSWQKQLKDARFSDEFIERVGTYFQIDESLCYKITVVIVPQGAGKIEFNPAVDVNKIRPGTKVMFIPKSVPPYEFDSYEFKGWGGSIKGRQIKEPIEIYANCTLEVNFREVKMEEPFPAVPTPKPGNKYEAEVIGEIQGEGESKDWIIKSKAYYNYVYRVKYHAEILGVNEDIIREKRTFHKVDNDLFITNAKLNLDMMSEYKTVRTLLEVVGSFVDPRLDMVIKIGGHYGERYIRTVEKMTFREEDVKKICGMVESLGLGDISKQTREFLDRLVGGELIQHAPNMRLLEGKTFILTYENGVGLKSVDMDDKNQIVTAREKEILQRAFYLSDYYIFLDRKNPQRKLRIGDEWEVDARTLFAILDPDYPAYAEGVVVLSRGQNPDSSDGSKLASLVLERGKVNLVSTTDAKEVNGYLEFYPKKGNIVYDLTERHVREFEVQGKAQYSFISKDHLLFEAKMHSEPEFSAKYQCRLVK